MKKTKWNLSIDKLEITYQATQQVRDALAAIEDRKVINEITVVRDKPLQYQNMFHLFGKDYSEKQGVFEREIGTLYFGSFNQNRQYIYINFDNSALYDTYLLASRFYVGEALGLDFLRVSKIDLALDLNINVVRRINRIYRDEALSLVISNKCRKSMDEIVNEVLHIAKGTRKVPMKYRSFYIKNKSLTMRCYNKSKEIEKNHKDYIPNISGKLPMYRLEVSLANHKTIVKTLSQLGVTHEEEVYSKLQSKDFLFSLFLTTLNRLIRVKKGRKCVSLLDYLIP